ncbi:hypothetical protein FRB91_010346 [Serendipita sp. 411]|nr:hypothetical protein FRB91_010346 [Serendipita sp. 411]
MRRARSYPEIIYKDGQTDRRTDRETNATRFSSSIHRLPPPLVVVVVAVGDDDDRLLRDGVERASHVMDQVVDDDNGAADDARVQGGAENGDGDDGRAGRGKSGDGSWNGESGCGGRDGSDAGDGGGGDRCANEGVFRASACTHDSEMRGKRHSETREMKKSLNRERTYDMTRAIYVSVGWNVWQ